MMRSTNIPLPQQAVSHQVLIFQAVINLLLSVVTVGMVTTWLLFYMQETAHRKRPGINIKEF